MVLPPPKTGLDLRRCVWRLACDVKEDRLNQFSDLQTQIYSMSRESPFEYLGMMQLWKGLYYLLWKEDSEELQRSLAQRIAGLLQLFPGPEEEGEDEGVAVDELGEQNGGEQDEASSSKSLAAEGAAASGSVSLTASEGDPGEELETSSDSPSEEESNAVVGEEEAAAVYGGQSTLFLRCGLETLCREWTKIDYLRMDKFLYLVRCLVRALCVQILQCPPESEESENLMSTFVLVILSEGRISSMLSPTTLVMQFADVWCDSVRWAMRRAIRDKSVSRDGQTGGMTKELYCFMFLPWLEFVATTPNSLLASHVVDSVFEDMMDYTYEPPYNFGDYIGEGGKLEGDGDGSESEEAEGSGSRARAVADAESTTESKPTSPSQSRAKRDSPPNAADAKSSEPVSEDEPLQSPLSDMDFLSFVLLFAANEDSQNQELLQRLAEELDAYQRWWAEDGRPAFLEESSEGPDEDPSHRKPGSEGRGSAKRSKHHRRELRKADLEARELKDKINAIVYRQAQGEFENLERNEEGVLEYHPRLQHKRERDLLYHYGIRKTALSEGRAKYEERYGETEEQRRAREAELASEAREELERIEAEQARAAAAREKRQKSRSKARKKILGTAADEEQVPVASLIPDEDSDPDEMAGASGRRPRRSSQRGGPAPRKAPEKPSQKRKRGAAETPKENPRGSSKGQSSGRSGSQPRGRPEGQPRSQSKPPQVKQGFSSHSGASKSRGAGKGGVASRRGGQGSGGAKKFKK